MKQDGSVALFQYWNRLRNGRPSPKRTEIEPADIKTLLSDTFILEKDTRGEAVFRLAGTRLCAIYGRELKGFSFPSLWRDKDQRLLAKLIHNVFHAQSIVVVSFDGKSRSGRVVGFEMIVLPLDGGVESPRCIGIVSSEERPFWLGTDPVVDGIVQSVRVVDPDREPLFLKNRPAITVPSLAPSDLSSETTPPQAQGARRIRHLVVLDGGRLG